MRRREGLNYLVIYHSGLEGVQFSTVYRALVSTARCASRISVMAHPVCQAASTRATIHALRGGGIYMISLFYSKTVKAPTQSTLLAVTSGAPALVEGLHDGGQHGTNEEDAK